MIVLSGATLVLPDRLLSPGTLVIENGRIAEIRPDVPSAGSHSHFAFHDHYLVPGFIDVHVHGVEGVDTLDDRPAADSVATIAAALPRYGVAAFCPTTVACAPEPLRRVLDQVRRARQKFARLRRGPGAAGASRATSSTQRCAGAQPAGCLPPTEDSRSDGEFTAVDILREIERAAPDVGIVTVAPTRRRTGADSLARRAPFRASRSATRRRRSTSRSAIGAGARATHLFNRMPPLVIAHLASPARC
jgi:N-acetylglucosamine-6-phosphate deacetylase